MGVLYGSFGSNQGLSEKAVERLKQRYAASPEARMFQAGGPLIEEKFSNNALDDIDAFHRATGFQAETSSATPAEAMVGPAEENKLIARTGRGKEFYNVGAPEVPAHEQDKVAQLEDFAEYLNHREMSGRKDAKALKEFNRFGYVGAMQMGTAALEDVGLLKRGVDKRKRAGNLSQKNMIMDESNWVGGAAARDGWMSSWEEQKASAMKLGGINRSRLADTLNAKGITDVNDQISYMVAAHLGGASSVKKALNGGEERKDGNNVGIWNYRDGFLKWLKENSLKGQVNKLPKVPQSGLI